MRFLILESALFEDIEDAKQYYPNIDDDTYYTLIELDPTFKKGSTKFGNYGKWILNLYKQGKLKDEDFYKVTDYLKEFDTKKKNFQNKDIGQFKSLPDLAKALDGVEDVERSDRQIRRDKTRSKEYDIVFKDDKWTIYVPKTYGASRMLGDGTQWCTASSNERYYNEYSKQGNLYILISNSDPDEKYQFHFESEQFMDKYDEDILYDVRELINDDKVFDFFRESKKQVPVEFINFNKLSKEELIKLASDGEPRVRATVAEQGYGLDKLVNDEFEFVRAEVARQGYGLNKLVNDEDWGVREAVAQQGYSLDKLVNDRNWRVRKAVAEQGYGLDRLVNDENAFVREEAERQLAKRNGK